MLSRNNKLEKNRKVEEKNNRFSIRKFTVGTASVLIGAFFMGINGTNTVRAADNQVDSTTASTLNDDLGLGDLLNNAGKVLDNTSTTQQAPTPAQTETQENEKVKVKPKVTVNVTLPTSPDPDNDYYYNRNVTTLEDDATATKAEDGNYTWQSVTHNSTSLNTVLSQSDFVYAKNGSWHNTIPDVLNYTPRLVEAEVQPSILPAELEGKVEKGTLELENALQAELENKIEENPYEFPEYTTTVPFDVRFYIEYEKNTPVKVETRERLNVTLPTSTDPDEDYYYGNINTSENEMTGTQSEDGSYIWNPVTRTAVDLNEALSQPEFVYAENGSWHNTLPSYPNYRAKLTDLTASSASPTDDNEADVDALMDELYDKIEENPYEIPEYTTTTPININFYVEYEKISDNGEVVTTPALPEYTGEVSSNGEALEEPALPEYTGKISSNGDALEESTLPEYTGKISSNGEALEEPALPEYTSEVSSNGEALEEPALPEYTGKISSNGEALEEPALPEYTGKVSSNGEALEEPALPEYTGEVSSNGEALEEPALPEYTAKVSTNNEALPAPVHQETEDVSEKVAPTTSTVKEHQANTEDTKVTTVAPHATNSNNNEGSTRTSDVKSVDTELGHAQISKNNTHFVRSVSNQAGVTGRPELVADQKQNNSRQAALPQTGAKTNVAGLLGVMVTGVATILGLAIDKKRKN